jgi:hypothetical protein
MTALANLKLPTRRYALGLSLPWEAAKYFKYWIVAAVLISFLGPLALSRYTDIDLSTWIYTANIAKWFTAFLGGGFLVALVPGMIAVGLTRRELSAAMGVFAALWSLALGALAFAAVAAERFYYDVMGWSQGIDANDVIAPIGTWGETLAFAAAYPLVFLLYFAAGALVGAASYRWENSGWLVLLPLIPLVFSLDNGLYDTEPFGPGWAGVLGRFIEDWGRAPVLVAIIAVTIGLAAAVHRVLIDIPLRSKKA